MVESSVHVVVGQETEDKSGSTRGKMGALRNDINPEDLLLVDRPHPLGVQNLPQIVPPRPSTLEACGGHFISKLYILYTRL